MKIDRLIMLLPCSGLDDLRLDRNLDEAVDLLSGWSALWHPALIHSAQGVPSWFPATQPPQYPKDYVIVLADCCRVLLPEGWLAEAEAYGAVVLQNLKNRAAVVESALEVLGNGMPTVESDLVADFLALGYCRLVVELLTMKLRYMCNINEDAFRSAVLDAANAAVDGDAETARRHLHSAFDRLYEAREYFYPTETRLIDLTILAPTTLGESLRKELIDTLPRNLLISGEVLEEMARSEPASLEAIKAKLSNNAVSIVGGEFSEIGLPLLTPDAIEFHLEQGLEGYKNNLGRRPVVFGRRRFGLNPALPGILAKAGFSAAMHVTLDDGQFPTGNQSCLQWEGVDGTVIDTLCKIPLDANRADSFLLLPIKLGNAMEMDHPATMVFAHWPGHVYDCYDDLRRIFSYSKVLGSFCTLEEFFQEAASTGQRVKFNADQYRSPYLVQDVAANRADSISRWVRYYRRKSMLDSARTIYALAAIVMKTPASRTACGLGEDLRKIEAALDQALNCIEPNESGLDQELQKCFDAAGQLFSQAVVGDQSSCGYLVVNPCSFSQQVGVDLPGLGAAPDIIEPVRAADDKHAVVDVPGMGFAWIGPGTGEKSSTASGKSKGWIFGKKNKDSLPLAEENIIRNEFFEVHFDQHTGAIRSISDYRSRHPRLAQQIALRTPVGGEHDPNSDANYSIMSAEEIRVTSSGPVFGEIVTCGKLMDRNGHRLAGFRQTTRAWRGSRVLELEIELDVDRQPSPNPWNSYYACRFAWHDETGKIYRSVNQTTQPTELMQLESPHFVDIHNEPLRTTILASGLPYHRRIGLRKLDTLLIVQGETARSFRLGVGIDLPNPMSAAIGFMSPKTMCLPTVAPPAKHGWLFHLDHRNVIAARWEPIWSGEGRGTSGERRAAGVSRLRDTVSEAGEGSGFRVQGSGIGMQGEGVVGFRVCLMETEGKRTQLGLRSFRAVASTQKIEPGDIACIPLSIKDDQIQIPIGPFQMIEVEVIFKE